MNIVVIHEGPLQCTRCLGWKQVDDGEHQSWKYWAELPEQSKVAIKLGLIYPVTCPQCNGTGIEPEREESDG